jgi:pyruvate dehydrogenase E2 component (dihydrolipoamide acetyltransferase)
VLAYVDEVRARTGEKVTLTHVVGKALARALAAEPSLNGRIVMGRYQPHDRVDVTFLVTMEDGSDLARAKVEHTDRKPVEDIARELREKAGKLRGGGDDDWEKSKKLVRLLPTFLLRPVLWFTGWLTGSLGVEAKALGLERFPFGSAIVTNVGVFGLDEAFVPPTPFARVPIYVLIGAVDERPQVVGGRIVARPTITLTATIDHRFIDGFQAGTLAREFRAIFEDPSLLDTGAAAPEPALEAV